MKLKYIPGLNKRAHYEASEEALSVRNQGDAVGNAGGHSTGDLTKDGCRWVDWDSRHTIIYEGFDKVDSETV